MYYLHLPKERWPIGLEGQGAFSVSVVLVSEINIKAINLLLAQFEIVEMVQSANVSFFRHVIFS